MRLRRSSAGLLALIIATLAPPVQASAGKPRPPVKASKATRSKPGRVRVGGPAALVMAAPLRRHRGEGELAVALRAGPRAGKATSKGRANRPARPTLDRWPAMRLESINTHEKLTLRLYDRRGRTVRASVRRLWRLMRCHLTNTMKPIHWRLIRNLYKVSRHYAGKTIYIYSGYRAQRVASLRSSNHVKGRAVDLRVAGVTPRALRDYLMSNFRPAGVGFYPNAPFVHFDVRDKQSAFWVDYSGKGESAEYATDPYAVLKSEKTRKTKPVAAPASQPATEAGADEPPAAKGSGEGAGRSPGQKGVPPAGESSVEEAKPPRAPRPFQPAGPDPEAVQPAAPPEPAAEPAGGSTQASAASQ